MTRAGDAIVMLLLTLALPASAHHPGANLDQLMGSRERYFQAIDAAEAPPFELVDADGNLVRLSDLADRIVVLHFIYAGCVDVCPLHAELIADVQAKINVTPMRDIVQFLSITTDPGKDTPDVLRAYGPAHGLDPTNWRFLTTRPGQPEDATRRLARAYGLRFDPLDDGQQMHAVVTHVVDRGGRFAAKLHGMRFDPLNLVLYINGLVNQTQPRAERHWWDRLRDVLY